jgi:trehalose-phosphatase
VRAFTAPPGRLLVVSDFDGTLSEIVADPAAARILPLARGALRRLARVADARPDRLAVAVLSGRAALDVAARVRVGGLRYLGNHGLEAGLLPRRGRPDTLVVSEVEASGGGGEPGALAVEELGEQVASHLGRPEWLFVERKGPSIAFHYRQADDHAAARSAVMAALTEIAGIRPGEVTTTLELIEGRRVVELRPAGSGGKAAALERLIADDRPSAVLFLGDDVSDGEAFRALTRARDTGRIRGLAVAVLGAADTPAWVAEAADLALGSPRDAARLLSFVARLVEREPVV